MSSRTARDQVRATRVVAAAVAALLAIVVWLPSAAVAAGPRTSVAFTAQPADVQLTTGAPIHLTTADVDATGGPIQVAVLDADGLLATNAKDAVSVRLVTRDGSTPATARLRGTTTRTAISGVATFDDLHITLSPGGELERGYRLIAEAKRLTPDASDAFDVWEQVRACPATGTCDVSASRRNEVSVQVDAGPNQGTLLLSLLEEAPDCGDDASHAPLSTYFDSSLGQDTTKLATVTIASAVVRRSTNNGANHYQVCYQGDAPFTTNTGDAAPHDPTDPLPFGPALLPDCGPAVHGPTGPCVVSRSKMQNGDVKLVVLLPAGDPMFR